MGDEGRQAQTHPVRLDEPLMRAYALGSLRYSAWPEAEIPALAEPAWDWYRALVRRGYAVPFALVFDLGYLLRRGEGFRFRSFPTSASAWERRLREDYETRLLRRRLQEANFQRLRRLLRDSPAPELALTRALEILLEPLKGPFGEKFQTPSHLPPLAFDPASFEPARTHLAQAVGDPNLWLKIGEEINAHGAEALDLDRRFQEEDFYELEHIQALAQEPHRWIVRALKRVERELGPPAFPSLRFGPPPGPAETSLESVGVYPAGGFAEVTTRGTWENLLPSELLYLEPAQHPDPFTQRWLEGELLFYQRDEAMLQMRRRTFRLFVEAWSDLLDVYDPAGGIKDLHYLLGLAITLVADLRRIFQRDEVRVEVTLVGEGWETADREVLTLLFRSLEEQGQMALGMGGKDWLDELSAGWRAADRSVATLLWVSPATAARLQRAPFSRDPATLIVPILTAPPASEGPEEKGPAVVLEGHRRARLQTAREGILRWVLE